MGVTWSVGRFEGECLERKSLAVLTAGSRQYIKNFLVVLTAGLREYVKNSLAVLTSDLRNYVWKLLHVLTAGFKVYNHSGQCIHVHGRQRVTNLLAGLPAGLRHYVRSYLLC